MRKKCGLIELAFQKTKTMKRYRDDQRIRANQITRSARHPRASRPNQIGSITVFDR
jgi:hypothetical protein